MHVGYARAPKESGQGALKFKILEEDEQKGFCEMWGQLINQSGMGAPN
jgi:hypothetical protein